MPGWGRTRKSAPGYNAWQEERKMAWISVKDFAALQGVSERAIRKGIASGRYNVREIPHPSRRDQVSYEIWLKSAGPECGTA